MEQRRGRPTNGVDAGISTQPDRKAERQDNKASRKEREQKEREEKRAKAEQFRLNNQRTSLVKKNQVHDHNEDSRFPKMRKIAKNIRTNRFFNPNSN